MLFHDANTSFRGKMVISRLHLVTSSDYTYNESIRLECVKFFEFCQVKIIEARMMVNILGTNTFDVIVTDLYLSENQGFITKNYRNRNLIDDKNLGHRCIWNNRY